MDHFDSYQDQQRRRAALLFGGAVAAGAFLSVRNVRQGIARIAGRAATRVGELAFRDPEAIPSRLQGTARELDSLLNRRVVAAARVRVGHDQAFGQLAGHLSHAEAEEIRGFDRYSRFLFSRRVSADEFLATQRMRQFTARQAAAQAHAQGTSLADAMAHQQGRLRSALQAAQNAVPSFHEAQGFQTVAQARQAVSEAAGHELSRLAQARGPLDRALGFFGVQPATLGQMQGPRWDGVREFLAGHVPDHATLHSLPVGGIYRLGEETFDARGAGRLLHQGLDALRDHVQIPLAPGAMGINPLALFPWWQGRLGQQFGHIGSQAVDSQLMAQLGRTGTRLGTDIFKVGSRYLEADFGAEALEGAAGAVRPLAIEGELRSGIWGYMKRRTLEVRAAEAAHAAGSPRNPWEWLGLFGPGGPEAEGEAGHLAHNVFGRAASVFTKFRPDSHWAPRVLGRVLTQDMGELVPEDVRRAAGFLRSGQLSPAVRQALLGQAGSLADADLTAVAEGFHDDTVLTQFLDRAMQRVSNSGPGQHPFRSQSLNELVHQWSHSPQGLFGRYQPPTSRGVFGYNFVGEESPLRWGEMARRALLDEMEERLVADRGEGALLGLLQGLPLGQAERLEAEAYAHGKAMGRLIEQSQAAPTWKSAASYLRDSAEAQEVAERFTARRARPWHAHVEAESMPLRTAELFSQRAFHPGDALADYNRARTAGDSHHAAFWNGVVKGRFGRQFGAFFTGNQADVTDATMFLEYFPRRLNQLLEEVGFGLPGRDLRSGGSVLSNLFTKRILPAVAAVETYRYLDFEADEHGAPGPSDLYAGARSRLGRLRARLTGDRIAGIRRELLPGLDRLLPDRTDAEEQEHQESGYEAVRKGRFWSIGSRGELRGEKIDYFLPAAVRIARSGWQGAENADQSTAEYWRHSFLPNPRNFFLGPLGPALWDPYWYERAHQDDRPYLLTGERFDNYSAHGGVANLLLGWTKPQQVLHPEYVPERLGGTASEEDLRRINEALKNRTDENGIGSLVGGGGYGPGGPGGPGGGGYAGTGGGMGGGYGSGEFMSAGYGGGRGAPGALARETAAGQLTPVHAPGGLHAGDWGRLGHARYQDGQGERLSRSEVARINRLTRAGAGGNTNLKLAGLVPARGFSREDLARVDYENPRVSAARNLLDVMGLYGFMAEHVLGEPRQPSPMIESAQVAYGFNRRFYDLNLGGLGGPFSEMGRRIMARRKRSDTWNPVRNRMPGWLPGPEYFQDFLHGDPYTKIARGELRLPGEAYERLHPEVRLLETRASSIGKSVGEIMQGMLHLEEPSSAYAEQVMDVGTRMHRKLQRHWQRLGVLVSAEGTLYDPELGISGHYDAILNTQDGLAVADLKTVSGKRFRMAQRHPFQEHLDQVNFYLHETHISQGMLVYVNRDDPSQVDVHRFGFDAGRYRRTVNRVQEARKRIWDMVDGGLLNRGDLYDPLSRFEVLADVAPYSEQFATLREYLVGQNKQGQLDPAENARFQAVKRRASAVKKRVEVVPDRFRDLELKTEWATVDRILDANTFTIRGSDNPIRLAGVRASDGRAREHMPADSDADPTEWMWRRFGVTPGAHVRLQLNADPRFEVSDDSLATRRAVVYRRGENVNRQLLREGYAVEKETDWSDAGTAARFTQRERALGSLWERFAHLDTPLHTKFLRVRNAREELERSIVFGKSGGSWNHPIRDFIAPTVESYATRNPLVGGAALGLFAQWFGRSRQAKLVLGAAGFAVGASAGTLRMGWEAAHGGEVWKPHRTRRREELEEYWDILKYVKARGMASGYEELAEREEHTDVQELARDLHVRGQIRKATARKLQREKRQLVVRGHRDGRTKARIDAIDAEIARLQEPQGMRKLGPYATRALLYRDQYRSTLYGIEPGETPFLNVIKAMPKYKRELVTKFLEMGQKDRRRVFDLLPRQEQRVLGHALGAADAEIPDRPELRSFFQSHPLPGPKWAGWQPGVNLDQLKQRAIAAEGLDPLESGIYPQQIEEAEEATRRIAVPSLRGRSHDIRRSLNELLAGRGLRGLRLEVDVEPAEHDELEVELDLQHRREQAIRDALQRG